MSYSDNETVQLTFRHTEEEYIAAVRLYFLHSKELLIRLTIICVLLTAGLMLLTTMIFPLPLWFSVALLFLVGTALYHGYLIDLPRRFFRNDPKFRDEYNLTVSDAGIALRTENISSSIAWNFYTRVIENDRFYLLIYGKNLPSFSTFPKRVFRDSQQEMTFRELLRRHVDPKLKLGENEGEKREYAPKSLEPPDWR